LGDDKKNGTTGRMIWMDLEMTGLDPERDTIIEIATLVTDTELNVVEEGPEIIIHQDPSWFEKMDDWNKEHHTKSGLWEKVVSSKISLEQAEKDTLAFIQKHSKTRESPLCGNSVWQDRRFLAKYMAGIDAHLHYRLVDVSTVKELAVRWYPGVKYDKKKNAHRAMDDIRESLEELKFYRDKCFVKV
jgi:oligoribonuclease